MHAAGLTFLVRWGTESPHWKSANGVCSADDVSVIAAATKEDGVFVAWRPSTVNPRTADPVVFRLTPNGETVRSFEIFVTEPDGHEVHRTTVSAIDGKEAVRVAMLAGHVFSDAVESVRATAVVPAKDPYRVCLVLAPETTHGGSVMDWEKGKTWAIESELISHPDIAATGGVRFRFDVARRLTEQEKPGAISRGSFMDTECAEWRYVVEFRFIERETRDFLEGLKLPDGWSMTFPQ